MNIYLYICLFDVGVFNIIFTFTVCFLFNFFWNPLLVICSYEDAQFVSIHTSSIDPVFSDICPCVTFQKLHNILHRIGKICFLPFWFMKRIHHQVHYQIFTLLHWTLSEVFQYKRKHIECTHSLNLDHYLNNVNPLHFIC